MPEESIPLPVVKVVSSSARSCMSSYKQTCVRSSINTGSDFISLIYFGE
jgi:hypothetical protein